MLIAIQLNMTNFFMDILFTNVLSIRVYIKKCKSCRAYNSLTYLINKYFNFPETYIN